MRTGFGDLDLNQVDYQCDVCVVGAGPAGITVAHVLATAGVDVLLVESGADEVGDRIQRLLEGESVGYPYYSLEASRQRGLGGSSLAWFRHTRFRPLDPLDFEKRSWLPHSGWPFGFAELRSYYERAHQLLPLGEFDYSAEHWEHALDGVRLPLDPRRVQTEVFQFSKGKAASGVFREVGKAIGERILTLSTVVALETDADGKRIDTITLAKPDGSRMSLRARTYVLAAGGIDNPRLLLASSSRWSKGLGNTNDLVGRFFQEHPGITSAHIVPDPDWGDERFSFYERNDVGEGQVQGVLKVADSVQCDESLLNCAITLVKSNETRTSDMYRAMGALSWRGFRPGRWPALFYARDLKHVLSHPGTAIKTMFDVLQARPRPRVWQLDLDAEQAPNRESRVTLADRTDIHGVPMARLDWRLNELDRYSFRRTQEILDSALREAGVGRLEHLFGDESPPVRFFGQRHHIGTTRMSQDPSEGVVDQHGRVHGLANLYITGSSVFPTGGYANPTMTIIAIALRLGGHLVREGVRSS